MNKTFYRYLVCLCLLLAPGHLPAQIYSSFFTGDTADVSPVPEFGLCLMGGGTENDNAMRWFLQKANGGDVVVIRASGSDGYNDYFFSELGVEVNSVETLLFRTREDASSEYVQRRLREAEAIWIAGGDQARYREFWRETAVDTLLNAHVNEKQAPLGGTSAGMAILGESYFSAENGTVRSPEALASPLETATAVKHGDFLHTPFLEKLVTDTHYDDPDRRGRHAVFVAATSLQHNARAFGIACEEYTAVCIEADGLAKVFGTSREDDYAWFLQASCQPDFLPEVFTAGQPLTWNRNRAAIRACKIKGTDSGTNTFNLADWQGSTGGQWQNWWVENGQLRTTSTENEGCAVVLGNGEEGGGGAYIFPNPAIDELQIENTTPGQPVYFEVLASNGQSTGIAGETRHGQTVNVSPLKAGLYLLKLQQGQQQFTRKLWIKR